MNELIFELDTSSKKVVDLVEIETSIGIFLCGTWDNKCIFFDFKDRKSIDKALSNKSKNFIFKPSSLKNNLHKEIEKQVNMYLQGKLKEFTIPLILTGTKFQKEVWAKLLEIPYGETISYGELAISIGNKKAMRAVGAANGANNFAIIIPCHRVINADGHLQGYAGGLWRKKHLIDLESNVKHHSTQNNLLNWLD